MSLDVLRDVSLKEAHELETQWHSILHEGETIKGMSIFFIHNFKYANYSLH